MCKIIKEGRTWFGRGEQQIAMAKEVCAECPVTFQCLDYSIITQQQPGVWGGMDEQERRPLLKAFAQQQELLSEAA